MEKKTSKNILLAIMGVLILAELVIIAIYIFSDITLYSACQLIALIFVALYGFWFYKKPHGNMLKYAMLILAFTHILVTAEALSKGYGSIYACTFSLFVDSVIIYVAGRLNRIEQNRYLLSFVSAGTIIGTVRNTIIIAGQASILMQMAWFSRSILIITLMIAYFVRYDEHKEAGLMDAPNK